MQPLPSNNTSQRDFFEKLFRQTTMEQIAELLYVKIQAVSEKHNIQSECAVCFVDEDSLEFSIHKASAETAVNNSMQKFLAQHIDSGVIGWSISQNKNSFFTPDEFTQYKTGLVIPIASSNYSFGVILVLCQTNLSELRGDFFQNVKVISNYVGMALENLRNMRTVGEYNQNLEVRIREKTFELLEKNAMLEHLAQELEEKKCKAEQANKIKTQFLANMSHEIRTPMNAIMGVATLLEQTKINDEQKEFVSTIFESGQILLNLMNDILDLSKIEAGEMTFEKIEVDLYAVIRSCLKIVRHKKSNSTVELLCKLNPSLPKIIITDPTKLRQILLNLLSNAIKFTSSGYVLLNIDQQNENLVLEIDDTGIGIEKKQQKKIFDSFVQASSSTTRNYGGTGLGLAITKNIAEKMNGSISLDSTPGQGSCFSVKLKLDSPDPSQTFLSSQHELLQSFKDKTVIILDASQKSGEIISQYCENMGLQVLGTFTSTNELTSGTETDYLIASSQLLPNETVHVTTKTIPLISCFSSQKPQESSQNSQLINPVLPADLLKAFSLAKTTAEKTHAPKKQHKPFCDKRILLAEDLLLNQKVAKKMLETIGFEVEIAIDGQQVLDKLKIENFDMVLMDYHMPVMDGAEATTAIRKPDSGVKNPNIPIVAMSANSIDEDINHCIKCGMNDYIVKPISLDKLETTLGKWLHRAETTEPSAIQEYFNPDEAFKLAGESHEIMLDLLTIFVEEFPIYLAKLKQALEIHDFENTKQNAHALKNMTSTIASKTLTTQALQIEEAARNHNGSKCKEHYEKLVACAPFVIDILKKKLKLEKL